MFHEEYRYGTGCLVLGMPGTGKSNLFTVMNDQHAMVGNALVMADYGDTIDRCLASMCAGGCNRDIWLLDATDARNVLPWNFLIGEGDTFTRIQRLRDAIIAPFREHAATMQTYRQVAECLIAFSLELGEPLHHSAELLVKENHQLRLWALENLKSRDCKATIKEIEEAANAKSGSAWQMVGSTWRRLRDFIFNPAILRMTGLPERATTIRQIRQRHQMLYVELPPGDAGRTLASILFSQCLGDSLDHLSEEVPLHFLCDEFGEVADETTGPLLLLTRKSGFRLTGAIHHLDEGRLAGNRPLANSLQVACQILYIFRGMPADEAKRFAHNLKIGELNENQEMAQRKIHYTEYQEDSEGNVRACASEDYEPIYAPLDLKLSWATEQIMHPPKWSCWHATPDGCELYHVPYIDDWREIVPPDELAKFREFITLKSIPADEADRIIESEYARFTERYGGQHGNRRKKAGQPPRLDFEE